VKEGVKTYLMASMSPFDLPTYIFCLHIYSLWTFVLYEGCSGIN
jgi:hypothetical protein